MRAMILCAGLGTRLRPLTERWPKPAVPLLGQPLIRYTLELLRAGGVKEVGINTHHLPEVMNATARAECERLQLGFTTVHEPEIQGTGGGIRGLKDFLRHAPALVCNGDVLFAMNVPAILDAHAKSGAAATMVLLPMPEGEKYNPVELDPDFNVRRIAGHGLRGQTDKNGPGGPKLTPWHFTGVHVLSPEVFDFMAATGAEDINRDVYPRLLAAGLRIHGHRVDARGSYWSDLGTPERYCATHQHLLHGQVKLAHGSPFTATPRGAGNFWAHPTAKLNDVRVSGPAWFGEGCELGQVRSVLVSAIRPRCAQEPSGARHEEIQRAHGLFVARQAKQAASAARSR